MVWSGGTTDQCSCNSRITRDIHNTMAKKNNKIKNFAVLTF